MRYIAPTIDTVILTFNVVVNTANYHATLTTCKNKQKTKIISSLWEFGRLKPVRWIADGYGRFSAEAVAGFESAHPRRCDASSMVWEDAEAERRRPGCDAAGGAVVAGATARSAEPTSRAPIRRSERHRPEKAARASRRPSASDAVARPGR